LKQDEIDYFKSSHCRHLRGQFFKYRDQQKYPPPTGRETADRVQADLDQIIRHSNVLGVSCIIPVPLYSRFENDPNYVAVSSKDAYHWAVQTVWMLCAEVMREMDRGNIVTLAHDNTVDFETLRQLYKGYKRTSTTLACWGDLIPRDDKTNPPIRPPMLQRALKPSFDRMAE
jgi:hypothetical protein